jgi:hypothetical protein
MAGPTRLERMARNPNGDWDINDVQRVCIENGLLCRPPPGGGSHHKVSSPGGGFILMIPARRRIKPVYIKALVGFILRLRDESNA